MDQLLYTYESKTSLSQDRNSILHPKLSIGPSRQITESGGYESSYRQPKNCKNHLKPLQEIYIEENNQDMPSKQKLLGPSLKTKSSKKTITQENISYPDISLDENLMKTQKLKKKYKIARTDYMISDRSITPSNFSYYEDICEELGRQSRYPTKSNISIRQYDRQLNARYLPSDEPRFYHQIQEEQSSSEENLADIQYSSMYTTNQHSRQQLHHLENHFNFGLEPSVTLKPQTVLGAKNFNSTMLSRKQRPSSKKEKKKPIKSENKRKIPSEKQIKVISNKALKRIENRLKVCSASYHEIEINKEAQHLKMRYENQKKAREQVKKGIIANSSYAKYFKP